MFDATMMMLTVVVVFLCGGYFTWRYIYMSWYVGDWSKLNIFAFVIAIILFAIILFMGVILFLAGNYEYNSIQKFLAG